MHFVLSMYVLIFVCGVLFKANEILCSILKSVQYDCSTVVKYTMPRASKKWGANAYRSSSGGGGGGCRHFGQFTNFIVASIYVFIMQNKTLVYKLSHYSKIIFIAHNVVSILCNCSR